MIKMSEKNTCKGCAHAHDLKGCGNHWKLVPLVENDWYFEKVIEEAIRDKETGIDKKKMSQLG